MISPDSSHEYQKATIEWNIIKAEVKNSSFTLPCYRSNTKPNNTILRNVAGCLTSGELVGIMGASGSGKSTLLSIVSGQSPGNIQTEGHVLIDGHENFDHLKKCTALVNQFHSFPMNITPREHIIFHALLRINSDIKDSEKISIAERTLKQMGLLECADNKIGQEGQINGISGGQRRRLGFAVELISNPKFLICDEPTSGLDSRINLEIMKLLKDFTKKGMGVLCSIHQPSSRVLELFDKIILLAEGQVAFIGTTDQAVDFYNRLGVQCPDNYTLTDFFIQVLNPKYGFYTVVCKAFNDGIFERNTSTERSKQVKGKVEARMVSPNKTQSFSGTDLTKAKKTTAPWFKQVRILTRRTFASLMHLTPSDFTRPVVVLVVSIYFGMVFRPQKPFQESQAKDVLGAAAFISCFGSSFLICAPITEGRIYWANNFYLENRKKMYSASAFVLSETFFELAYLTGMSILFSTLAFWIMGTSYSFVTFLCSTATVCCAAFAFSGLGGIFSSVIRKPALSRVATMLVFNFTIPFNNYFSTRSNFPACLLWIKYLVFQYYAMNSYSAFLFGDLDFTTTSNQTITGLEILQRNSIPYDATYEGFGCLMALGVCYRLIQVACLHKGIRL